jgi:diguanylate cyclase (GGDEF)-like protein
MLAIAGKGTSQTIGSHPCHAESWGITEDTGLFWKRCAQLELVYRFKSWNDNYGHASGDALLRELAVLLRAAATDPGDIVARNGGDEFCVVFADTEKSSAIVRAERLRASIADADFRGLHAPISSGEEVRISASIGVACFPVDAQSPEALLEKADEAMYHSKKTGRNGVSFFGVDAALVRGDGAAEERSADRRRE